MITWRSTGAGGYHATLMLGGLVLARLHARADAWQIQCVGGQIDGPAGNVVHAKRAALEKLAELLPRAVLAVQVALQSG